MLEFVYIDGVMVIRGPPGYKVNLANPARQYDITAYIIYAIGIPISTFCLAQYMYVKLRILRKVDPELVCLILGWLIATVMASIQIENYASKTIGVHVYEMPVMRAIRGGKMLIIVTSLNALTTGLCKTSLGIFYYKLSPQTWWKRANAVSIFFMASYNIAIFVVILGGCNPIQKNWLTTLPGHCVNKAALYIARAALGVISDLILLILPIPMIVGLRMPTRQKIGLIIFFAIGSVTLVTAVIRIYYLSPTLHTRDATWIAASSGVIILSESQLIVICAALPTLKQFFSQVAPTLLGERFSSAKSSKSSSAKRDAIIDSLRTIGRTMNRKRVDEFGMTIHPDGEPRGSYISMVDIESQHSGDRGNDNRGNDNRAKRRTMRYDAKWLETICDQAFGKMQIQL